MVVQVVKQVFYTIFFYIELEYQMFKANITETSRCDPTRCLNELNWELLFLFFVNNYKQQIP